MLLEDNTLKLRALEPYDLELLYDWENNTEIWEYGNTLAPYSKYVLHQYLENCHRDLFETKQLRLIIELKTTIPFKPIGIIDLFDIDLYNKRAGIGILIAEQQYKNKGFAALTLGLIEEYALKKLGLYQLHCKIDSQNHISLKLFQKSGYIISGKILNWNWSESGMNDVFFLQHFLK